MSDASAALALSTVALVPTVFGSALPPLSTVHDKDDTTGALARSVGVATATAGAVVLGVAALTRSPAVLVAGGATVLAYAALYRQAVAA